MNNTLKLQFLNDQQSIKLQAIKDKSDSSTALIFEGCLCELFSKRDGKDNLGI